MRIFKSTKKHCGLWISVRFIQIAEDVWNIDLIINKSKRTLCDWQNLRVNKRTKRILNKKSRGNYGHLHEAKKMIFALSKKIPEQAHFYITAENKRTPVLIKRALEKLGFTSCLQRDGSVAWVLTAHQRAGELQSSTHTK